MRLIVDSLKVLHFVVAIIELRFLIPISPLALLYLDVYHVDDLLVAAVGIKDYGEMDNKNLSQQFNVPEKLPSIKLFQNGDVTKWLDYSEGNIVKHIAHQHLSQHIPLFHTDAAIKTEELKQFVRRHSQVYIGLSGCIREFDEIASEFVNHYSSKAYDLAVEQANKLIDGYDDEKVSFRSGSVSVKVEDS